MLEPILITYAVIAVLFAGIVFGSLSERDHRNLDERQPTTPGEIVLLFCVAAGLVWPLYLYWMIVEYFEFKRYLRERDI